MVRIAGASDKYILIGKFKFKIQNDKLAEFSWLQPESDKIDKIAANNWFNCKACIIKLKYRCKVDNTFFTFFYVHQKKVLDLWKFSTSSFLWIYMFWDVLNAIWLFLENNCLYLCLQNFVDTVCQELMRGNWWNLIFSCTFI